MKQLESRTPDFIGVMHGFLCKQGCMCTTVCLDHYSYFRYTYIKKNVSMKDTLEDKSAFDTVS